MGHPKDLKTDLAAVRAALADIDEGYGVYDEVTPTLKVVIEAARRYVHISDLVDLRRIAEKLNVPLDTVNKWRYRELLPPPDYLELRNPVWNWETIEEWAKKTGRL